MRCGALCGGLFGGVDLPRGICGRKLDAEHDLSGPSPARDQGSACAAVGQGTNRSLPVFMGWFPPQGKNPRQMRLAAARVDHPPAQPVCPFCPFCPFAPLFAPLPLIALSFPLPRPQGSRAPGLSVWLPPWREQGSARRKAFCWPPSHSPALPSSSFCSPSRKPRITGRRPTVSPCVCRVAPPWRRRHGLYWRSWPCFCSGSPRGGGSCWRLVVTWSFACGTSTGGCFATAAEFRPRLRNALAGRKGRS